MDSYDKVAKVVAPKRAALAEAEAAYGQVMTALNAKQVWLGISFLDTQTWVHLSLYVVHTSGNT